jgi:PEP-CTERM motif
MRVIARSGKDLGGLSMSLVVRKALVFVALAPLVAFAPSRVEAGAALLPAGSTTAITAAQDGGATNPGTLLAKITSNFSFLSGTTGIDITGWVTSAVYQNAQGLVDIYYQVTNSTTILDPNLSISGLTGFNFGGSATSVGYYSDASVFGGLFASPTAGVTPQGADRTADGNDVTLWFGPPWDHKVFAGGMNSSILQIATNATNWFQGFATVQNHSVGTVASFGVSPVPEPEIYAMIGIGLGLLGWVRRRKKLNQAAAA